MKKKESEKLDSQNQFIMNAEENSLQGWWSHTTRCIWQIPITSKWSYNTPSTSHFPWIPIRCNGMCYYFHNQYDAGITKACVKVCILESRNKFHVITSMHTSHPPQTHTYTISVNHQNSLRKNIS